MMAPASRPVKVACLACRASKIRCDGQQPCASCASRKEVCRYQPSRRGGARRGPVAAEQLAQKRAHLLPNHPDVVNLFKPLADSSLPSSLSSVDPGPRTPNTLLETCDVGLSAPANEISDAEDLLAAVELSSLSIRAYRCDEDLINAYYTFIHPYFPLLPPPAVPQYEDKCEWLHIRSCYANASDLPYFPVSPLGLAVAAILVLIPPPGNELAGGDHEITLRRSFAHLFARSALECLEDRLGPPSGIDLAKGPRSILHCGVPQEIEPILALALLSIYEYCQHGNVPKMRARANQALTTAMDLSLHVEDGQMACLDARRRCWWSTVFIVYQSSILNTSAPFITSDDLRITTRFPEFRGCREPWPLLVKAQSTLLRSCAIGRQLVRETHNNAGIPRTVWHDIQILDSDIVELAAEVDRFRCVTNYQGAEADASRNLWAISNAIIHTSRLTLHQTRAFLDCPIISDQHCDLLGIDTVQSSPRTESQYYLSMGRISEVQIFFPFTEQESVRICLHSSLVISRVFRRLPSPNPMYSDTSDVETQQAWSSRRPLASPRSIPIMACCQMQGLSTMSKLLWRVRAAICSGNLNSYFYLLDRPSATTEVQGTERLIEELELGLETLGRSIQADTVFEGIWVMAKEAERLYESSMVD